ncbi:hypothetical protein GCM10011579_096970 [Streptomyces albiflavescens]|uniref:Uncharacterized protein n=1 Tax=Streptomyces albiflavescens TaxID=1623582 RepID=A0A917YGS7_9ACTN|nr:hypothetical protein GCM10011579_096970 [Streptomyces albiflavescens]
MVRARRHSVEDRVEALSEVAGVVADQVPDADGARVVQTHEEVSGALGGPRGGDVPGDTGDVEATGAVLDEEQDEQAPQENRVYVPAPGWCSSFRACPG